jgi:hypothetical protein
MVVVVVVVVQEMGKSGATVDEGYRDMEGRTSGRWSVSIYTILQEGRVR